MATAIVSGRVDESIKKIADAHIRRKGLTPAEVIAGVWQSIAETGEVPVSPHNESETRKKSAGQRLAALRKTAPLGTPLATMSDEDIKKELANRD